MSMGKRPTKNAAEHDVTTGWRHVLCYMSRPGVTSSIKRGMRRRERHNAKLALKNEVY